MITYEKFKKLFNQLDSNREPEIEIYVNDSDYLLIKFENHITYGKWELESTNEIYTFNNLDELYEANIEGICLKNDWDKVEDILIDLTFSVIDNKEELSKWYKVDL